MALAPSKKPETRCLADDETIRRNRSIILPEHEGRPQHQLTIDIWNPYSQEVNYCEHPLFGVTVSPRYSSFRIQ
jgi:hypothetical protein